MKFSSFKFGLIAMAALGVMEPAIAKPDIARSNQAPAVVASNVMEADANRDGIIQAHHEFKKDVAKYLSEEKPDADSKVDVIDDLEEIGKYLNADGKRVTKRAINLTNASGHADAAVLDSYEKVLEAISNQFGPGIVDGSEKQGE